MLKSTRSANCRVRPSGFSTLQRVEIAEITEYPDSTDDYYRFSTLQRVEIAEIDVRIVTNLVVEGVSVLFNESKLLKSAASGSIRIESASFQYSSTSRNC